MKLNNRKIKTTKTDKISDNRKVKIKEAKASYKKMTDEIKPFLKERKISQYSTAGQWKVLSYET